MAEIRKVTEQEEFWGGSFGDAYSRRNVGNTLLASNSALFAKIFARTGKLGSLIEFGANIGMNLRAISAVSPDTNLAGIELNATAAGELRAWGGCSVYEGSILDFAESAQWDMTLIKGVLIHINPDRLADVYKRLYERSSRFICVAEYYNPAPVAIKYRGHENKLFKRDFSGEMLDGYADLKLIDYGFCYHRDPIFPQDDITWFLMEKR